MWIATEIAREFWNTNSRPAIIHGRWRRCGLLTGLRHTCDLQHWGLLQHRHIQHLHRNAGNALASLGNNMWKLLLSWCLACWYCQAREHCEPAWVQ
jgi:hypothetical protein